MNNPNQFDHLPELLRAAQVMEILGVCDKRLRKMRECDKTLVARLPGMRQVRYRKARVLELLGI